MSSARFDERSRLRDWWSVAVLWLAAFVACMHRMVLAPMVDPLSRDLGISDAQIGLLQGAAFAIVFVFLGLPCGRLADRGWRRSLLVGGSAIWCAGTMMCGFAATIATLFAGRMLVGIGEAALAPAAMIVIGDIFPAERRGTAIGIFLSGYAIGASAAIALGGALLSAAAAGAFTRWPLLVGVAPWRCVLILLGSSGLLVPVLALTIRIPNVERGATEPALPLGDVIAWARRATWLPLLLLAAALLAIGDYGMSAWIPAALSRGFHWPPTRVGAALGPIMSLLGIAAPLLGGPLSDLALARGGETARFRLVALLYLISAVGAGCFAAAAWQTLLAGLVFWSLCSGLASTVCVSAIQMLVPAAFRGTSVSLTSFFSALFGLGLGPTSVALVTEHVYGSPAAVGPAIATVAVPTAVVAAMLVLRSLRALHAGKGRIG